MIHGRGTAYLIQVKFAGQLGIPFSVFSFHKKKLISIISLFMVSDSFVGDTISYLSKNVVVVKPTDQ